MRALGAAALGALGLLLVAGVMDAGAGRFFAEGPGWWDDDDDGGRGAPLGLAGSPSSVGAAGHAAVGKGKGGGGRQVLNHHTHRGDTHVPFPPPQVDTDLRSDEARFVA